MKNQKYIQSFPIKKSRKIKMDERRIMPIAGYCFVFLLVIILFGLSGSPMP